jgi:hypothetical protein
MHFSILDHYLPEFDVRTSYATRIAVSPARAYAEDRIAISSIDDVDDYCISALWENVRQFGWHELQCHGLGSRTT